MTELWATTRSIPAQGAKYHEIEDEGWDGLTFTDSQNISGDPYVAMTNAVLHTSRLQVAPGVTNPVTRHPAATSSAIHAINVFAPGRVSLGVGRGDSALAHLGSPPASPETLRRYLTCVQQYLSGAEVPIEEAVHFAGREIDERLPLADRPLVSALRWQAKAPEVPKVPVFVAASGPKVIGIAAELGDRVTLAVGADPERVAWGVRTARATRPDVPVSAYVNVVVDDDADRAFRLAAGRIATMARFSAMHGAVNGPAGAGDRAVFEAVPRSYQMTRHTAAGSQVGALTEEFVGNYAILGPASRCVERLLELAELGVDRFHVIGGPAREGRELRRRFARDVIGPFRDQCPVPA